MGDSIYNFIPELFINSFYQLISILGIFFIFGFLLSLLSTLTRMKYSQTFGEKFNIYWTGLIGTPIHEIGHAIFCIIFGLPITKIQLFNPDSHDLTRGYISFAYQKNSLFKKVGIFFASAGPIILGTYLLYLAIYFLVPNGKIIIDSIKSWGNYLSNPTSLLSQFDALFHSSFKTSGMFFTIDNMTSVKFWIFIYLSLCISSHMQLSAADMKGIWWGVAFVIVVIFIINIISPFLGNNVGVFINSSIHQVNTVFLGLMIYAISVSALNCIISFFIYFFFYPLIKRKKFNN
jgi:hypothetical protein